VLSRAWRIGPAFGALAIGILAVALPHGAAADVVGVGVSASPIALGEQAHPGSIHRLPDLYVVNTGTGASFYHLKVEELSSGDGRTVPPDWVHFARNDFELQPKESASVPLTLNVPADARSGSYVSDLVVGTVPRHYHGGAIAGAQAATKLVFRVGGTLPDGNWPWWTYTLIGLGVALAIIAVLLCRSGFRVKVEIKH
jgi:hypothetical protein